MNTTLSTRPAVFSISRICGLSFPLIAVALACGLSLSTKQEITIRHPLIPFLGCLILLLPAALPPPAAVRSIVALYLGFIPISQVALAFYPVSILGHHALASYTLPIAALCILGQCVRVNSSHLTAPGIRLRTVVASMILLVGHLGLLYLLLRWFYGYGYDRGLAVVGNLSLFSLLFLCLHDVMQIHFFRRLLGAMLLLFYLAHWVPWR